MEATLKQSTFSGNDPLIALSGPDCQRPECRYCTAEYFHL